MSADYKEVPYVFVETNDKNVWQSPKLTMIKKSKNLASFLWNFVTIAHPWENNFGQVSYQYDKKFYFFILIVNFKPIPKFFSSAPM